MEQKPKQIDATMRGAINFADTHVIEKNIATNGRVFVILLAVANLVALHAGMGQQHFLLAVVAAISVGIATLAEQFDGPARTLLTVMTYGAAVAVAFFSLIAGF